MTDQNEEEVSGGRPAPSMCIVCREDLLQYDEANGNETPALRPLVTLRCGHLFHTTCVNKWFATMRGQEFKSCPFCQKEMWANDIKRIFPVSGDSKAI